MAEEKCSVCEEEIYFNETRSTWVIRIETSYWDTYHDEFDWVEREINFCYECGKDYRSVRPFT